MKYGRVEFDPVRHCYRVILPGGESAGFKTETRAYVILRQIREKASKAE